MGQMAKSASSLRRLLLLDWALGLSPRNKKNLGEGGGIRWGIRNEQTGPELSQLVVVGVARSPPRGSAHRRGHLGGKRRSHLPRRADRPLGEIQAGGPRHAGSVSPQSAPGLGMVRVAAATRRRRATQSRPPGAGGDRAARA